MKKLLLLCTCGILCANAMADNTVTYLLNGAEQQTNVTRITFNGDKVFINGTETEDLTQVKITFTYDATTGIQALDKYETTKNDARVYNLNGQFVGRSLQGLSKGIYISNGKKFVVK